MSALDALKGLVFKKKPASQATPDENAKEAVASPYLNARREWNDHVGSVVTSKQTWQVMAILSMLIALAAVGGIIHIGSQSKFIPYVYEVDNHGQAVAVGPITSASPVDRRVVHATVAQFIADARMVTPDVALQRQAVYRVYSHLAPNDPATVKMNEWLNGNADASPFKRAATETVSIEITSVLPQTGDTWQVDWTETTRDRQGVLKTKPVNRRALVTVYVVAPTADTPQKQLRNNPAGIYVRDFSWQKLL